MFTRLPYRTTISLLSPLSAPLKPASTETTNTPPLLHRDPTASPSTHRTIPLLHQHRPSLSLPSPSPSPIQHLLPDPRVLSLFSTPIFTIAPPALISLLLHHPPQHHNTHPRRHLSHRTHANLQHFTLTNHLSISYTSPSSHLSLISLHRSPITIPSLSPPSRHHHPRNNPLNSGISTAALLTLTNLTNRSPPHHPTPSHGQPLSAVPITPPSPPHPSLSPSHPLPHQPHQAYHPPTSTASPLPLGFPMITSLRHLSPSLSLPTAHKPSPLCLPVFLSSSSQHRDPTANTMHHQPATPHCSCSSPYPSLSFSHVLTDPSLS